MAVRCLLKQFGRPVCICFPCRSGIPLVSSSLHTSSWRLIRHAGLREATEGGYKIDRCQHSGRLNVASCRGLSSGAGTVVSCRRLSSGVGSGVEWSHAMSEAEKIVGYPTSFMSLRCLLSDEISNLAIHMRKLVGSKHPLLHTARRFIYDGTHSLQMRGLLVLLLAKAAGPSPPHPPGTDPHSPSTDSHSPSTDPHSPSPESVSVTESMVGGIYPSQRSLAEITEMIHTAFLIHKGVLDLAPPALTDDLPPVPPTGDLPPVPPAGDLPPVPPAGDLPPPPPSDLQFGNKMSVLSGDFLLANASTALAQLYNTQVVEMISGAITDLATAEFTRLPPGGASVEQWEKQTFLASGSLLARSCQAVMLLASHDSVHQEAAFNFGRSVCYAYQLHEELSSLLGVDQKTVSINSMPVIIHLNKQPADRDRLEAMIDRQEANKQICDVLAASGSIDDARDVTHRYKQDALRELSVFGASDASSALVNIVKAVTEV